MLTRPAVLLMLLASCPQIVPQAHAQAGVVSGRVVDRLTREGIVDAVVEVPGLAVRTRTVAAGRFTLTGVPLGLITLRVAAIGYTPRTLGEVAVGSGRPVPLLVELESQPVSLATLSTTVDRPDGLGGATGAATLGRDETRRAPGVQEDIVRAVALLPGVGVTQRPGGARRVGGGEPLPD
jgi:hypothetical protein